MTACGFCVVAALSNQISGRPWIALAQDREVAPDGVRIEEARLELSRRSRGRGNSGRDGSGRDRSGPDGQHRSRSSRAPPARRARAPTPVARRAAGSTGCPTETARRRATSAAAPAVLPDMPSQGATATRGQSAAGRRDGRRPEVGVLGQRRHGRRWLRQPGDARHRRVGRRRQLPRQRRGPGSCQRHPAAPGRARWPAGRSAARVRIAARPGGDQIAILVVPVDFHAFEHAQRVLGQDGGRAVERHQVRGGALGVDAP